MAFRDNSGQLRDFLLADAPGEWFQRWAINREAVEAAGARWVAEHADIFLLFADREALAGEDKGSARGAFQLLARRLAAELLDRPLALVWSKVDVTITTEIEEAVRGTAAHLLPNLREFSISVISGDEAIAKLLQLLDWTLTVQRAPVFAPAPPQISTSDPFFAFGRP
jgi:hypothetical protein